MLDMLINRDLRAFSKLRQLRKNCSLSSTSKLQLPKRFKVSRDPCLNFCLFKWQKQRLNLFNTFSVIGIEYRSFARAYKREKFVFESCNRLRVLYLWHKLRPLRPRIQEERMFKKIRSATEKRSLLFACVIKAFTRWYNIENLLRALSSQ